MLPERRQDLVLSGTCHWLHEPEAGGLHVAVHALVGLPAADQSELMGCCCWQFDSVDCQVVRVFIDTHNVKYWLIDTLQVSGRFCF